MMRFPGYHFALPAMIGVPYVLGAIGVAVTVMAVDAAFGHPLARSLQEDHDEEIRDHFGWPPK